jgi:hypothetical protein
VPVHLLKVAVGIADLAALEAVQRRRTHQRDGRRVVFGYTRRMPVRRAEVIDGGSIYWIIRQHIRVRQRVLDLVETIDEADGRSFCRMILDPQLVAVEPVPRQPIQGWRYFAAADAPPDAATVAEAGDLPPHLRHELRALGLL